MNFSVDQLTSRYVAMSRSKLLEVKSKRAYVSTNFFGSWALAVL